MTRPARVLLLVLAFLGLAVSILEAQDEAPLRFSIVPETGEALVEIVSLFEDPGLQEAVLSGLPLRIRIVVQLWKDGRFFDSQKGQHEWRASVVYDPLTRRYRVQAGGNPEVEANTLPQVQATLQQTLPIPIRPSENGRYYYLALVEMETLSLTDLEELRRWLRGDLGAVVSGEDDVEGALGNGLRRVFVRMLGLPARKFQVRSPRFEIGEGDA